MRLSVAADEANAHALRENEDCAAAAKSWVFIREERGSFVVVNVDDGDDVVEDGGGDGAAVGCQTAGTLASSSLPMVHSSDKVVLMSEGAWTSE